MHSVPRSNGPRGVGSIVAECRTGTSGQVNQVSHDTPKFGEVHNRIFVNSRHTSIGEPTARTITPFP